MGATISSETNFWQTGAGNFWQTGVEQGTEPPSRGSFRESIEGREDVRSIISSGDESARETESESESTSEAEDLQELTLPGSHRDFVPSPTHRATQVAPVNTEVESQIPDTQARAVEVLQVESQIPVPQGRVVIPTLYRNKLFSALFLLHIVAVTAGIVYLGVHSALQKGRSKIHYYKRWYAPLGTVVVVGSAFGCAFQTALKLKPREITEVVLWTNAVLTLSAAVMLLATAISLNVALGALLVVFAIAQSLYSCWVSRRLKYAGDILSASLVPANKFSGIYCVSNCILMVASFWLSLWIFGLVGAIRHSFSSLIILAMLGSLAWTMEVLRNIVHGTVAMVVAQVYLDGSNPTQHSIKRSLHRVLTTSFGSICLGSLIVPILHVLRVMATGLSRTQGENEFMFSCADCFMGVMDTLIGFGNNWAYVQVVVYGKPFIKASQDTWDLIKNRKLDVLINTELTSSVCALSGISGGMLCVLVSGGWTFATHKTLTTSISILAFVIGYSLVRITMAVPQGSVAVHYVCYAENPTNQQLMHSPISERLKELLRDLA